MAKIQDVNDGDYFQLPWGRAIFHNNEWHLETDRDDPAGISMIGGAGCKISWKDAGGNEKVLIQLRRNSKGDGEIYVGCLSQEVLDTTGNLDRAMIEVATINPNRAEIRVPVKLSAGTVPGTPLPSEPGVQLGTLDGRYIVADQSDGNLVVYDRGIAVWDRWSYEAGLARNG